MKKERVIPKKNYLYLILMILSVVLITVFIFDLNDKIMNKKLESSYFKGYINEVSLNEISDVLVEPSSELFVLVTKTNDNEVYRFESDLKKIIKKYDIRDNFIYIDFTNKENSLGELNKIFGSDVKDIPAIIYIKNGIFVKAIEGSQGILNSGEFEKLLDEYEVK